jgi:hypothetical protein
MKKKRAKLKHGVYEEQEDDYLLTPMRKLCWDKYTNPKSPTFSNASASARAAGFAPTYARIVMTREWFKQKKMKLNLLGKSEKVLDKVLSIQDTVDDKGKERADLLRVQVDAAKHVTKTLGKDEGWSERQEITGAGGEPVVFLPAELIQKYDLGEDENK